MALLVTRPVEEAIRSHPRRGVTCAQRNTRGGTQIEVNFGWGRDMVCQHTAGAMRPSPQVLPDLPQGTGYDVRRMDPTVYPVRRCGQESVAIPDLPENAEDVVEGVC